MKKNYESPKMALVSIQSDEAVANICWGGNTSAQNLTWAYYGDDHAIQEPKETDPEGWFTFQVNAGNCKQATNANIVITYQGTASNDSEKQAALRAAFLNDVDVSNAGSPWSGEGTITPVIGGSK